MGTSEHTQMACQLKSENLEAWGSLPFIPLDRGTRSFFLGKCSGPQEVKSWVQIWVKVL